MTDAAAVHGIGNQCFREADAAHDGVFAQERFPSEKRYNQVFLLKGECAFKSCTDGLLEGRIFHDRVATGLRFFIIAIGTAQVALFRKA